MKKPFGKRGITAVGIVLMVVAAIAALVVRLGGDHQQSHSGSVKDVPAFSGEAYVVISNNEPEFSEGDLTDKAYEYYSQLDELGRCGYAMACIGKELMPTQERQGIGQVKPSGWQIAKYDFVDGKYLYNRCHLIGFQLTGENANEKNLITGTRYMNVDGMLPFENMVADYIRETGNHVLYRVTPIFDGNNLVASGVQMEACSVEDKGAGIMFNVYVYNNQPGVQIDYASGDSWLLSADDTDEREENYILNTNSKRFHRETCESVDDIRDKNKEQYTGFRQTLIDQGYVPCGSCTP